MASRIFSGMNSGTVAKNSCHASGQSSLLSVLRTLILIRGLPLLVFSDKVIFVDHRSFYDHLSGTGDYDVEFWIDLTQPPYSAAHRQAFRDDIINQQNSPHISNQGIYVKSPII